MNFVKFLYDVFVYVTNNYSQLPDSFRSSFPEENCINARLFLSDFAQSNSDINQEFKNYE